MYFTLKFSSIQRCLYLIALISASVSLTLAQRSAEAVFSNTTPITIPASPEPATASPYPSAISVTGMTGTIANSNTSVKVTINGLSHNCVSDLAIVLVGPGGQALMLQGRGGFCQSMNNVTYTFSDSGTGILPDPTWGPGTYKPTNWAGQPPPDFPAPGPRTSWANPGPSAFGTATLASVYSGTNPNGTWNLFVLDLFEDDGGSIAGGWSIEITTVGGAPVPDAQGDYDGDGSTDYAVVRNAGDINGQITWHISHNSSGISRSQNWGLGNDSFVPADYDGDQKDDIAVWRPGVQSVFYIIQSQTNTIKAVEFGNSFDNPSVVGDYNNDGSDDIAVYRQGASAGDQSFFYFSYGGVTYAQAWGLNGDIPAPGDYDGDNRMDFAIQRGEGANGVFYIRYMAHLPDTVITFGLANDIVVPGYYDSDARTDLAVISENGSGFFEWKYRPSAGGADVVDEWGIAATDIPVPGDYNGDGKNDYAVWRPGASAGSQSTFYVMTPVTRFIYTRPWGLTEDEPVNKTFAHD